MKKALILHCWYSHPEDHWYPWLKGELEKKGYEVWLPELPTMSTDMPEMERMISLILDKKFVDENTTIVGHSLGALLTLRLAERIPFKMGILVAGWDFNDLTSGHQSFWPKPIDHATIKKHVLSWLAVISENDPYITLIQAQDMASRLGGKGMVLGTKGHFLEKNGVTKIPELIKYF